MNCQEMEKQRFFAFCPQKKLKCPSLWRLPGKNDIVNPLYSGIVWNVAI